jgi:hypothetical protein
MRSQSPGYPNAALPKAIASVRQIFDADRRNPIERELAAKHIGYSGSSGAADKAIATLAHYGLTEKVGKGEIRVSQLALDIIHPEKPDDRKRALLQAAFSPQIFKDLRERFSDGHVSEGALESYLKRENFLDRAITPVTKAYLETCRFLEQEKAFESGGADESKGGESASSDDHEADEMELTAAPRAPAPPTGSFMAAMSQTAQNEMKVMLDGDVLRVSAVVDLKGAKKLLKALKANMALLEDDDGDGEDE